MENKQRLVTLVIGASENPVRYSNIAAKRLRSYGHPVVALGLRRGQIEDVEIITDRDDISNIDTVTLYIGPKNQADYFGFLVKLSPRRIIFNPGTENPKLYQKLKDNDIEFIEACTLVMLSVGDY